MQTNVKTSMESCRDKVCIKENNALYLSICLFVRGIIGTAEQITMRFSLEGKAAIIPERWNPIAVNCEGVSPLAIGRLTGVELNDLSKSRGAITERARQPVILLLRVTFKSARRPWPCGGRCAPAPSRLDVQLCLSVCVNIRSRRIRDPGIEDTPDVCPKYLRNG
ncbi:hypothetical protein EVAR_9269_1 [Eumeta japonica]|uniref:Uncharacterized protein n=1 Tax=Eumeta variegata TaxID=151549 RepID=A0A4C1TMK1_EUMVA|nr:hypothetical protein EVAR_9269_1 [Eumeta japonica]